MRVVTDAIMVSQNYLNVRKTRNITADTIQSLSPLEKGEKGESNEGENQ